MDLPVELITEIGLHLNLRDFFNLCLINRNIHFKLCKNNYFWHRRFIQDLGKPAVTFTENWQEMYKSIYLGKVYGFGDNTYCQIGKDFPEKVYAPVEIPGLRARDIAAGYEHSMIIDWGNHLLAFGGNIFDQLGIGRSADKVCKPIRYIGFRVKKVSTGHHTLVIDLDVEGKVWGFGSNARLGLSLDFELITAHSPTQLPGFPLTKDMAVGETHSLVIDFEGSIWATGANSGGQLGLGYLSRQEKITKIPGLRGKSVTAGRYHSLVVDPEGGIWVFGYNLYGELGLPEPQKYPTPIKLSLPPARVVAAGEHHSIVIDIEGVVWTFGNNGYGQLGTGDRISRWAPTRISLPMEAKLASAGGSHTVVIASNGTVWAFGNNSHGQLGLSTREIWVFTPTQIPYLKAWAVSAGDHHTLVIGKKEI